ncbi:1-deoxy-D-xylulose-5-phosphate reductoisomerase [Halomonadaceae bacterium KBTZ08]
MGETSPQTLTILGATGSIGSSTLDVVARHPERFRVHALSAHSNVEALAGLCHQFRPRLAVISDPSREAALREALAGLDISVLSGEAGLCEAASDAAVDTVMASIVGAAGLAPTMAAIEQGKRVLLANKEALVMSGGLFMEAVERHGATLLPIDSEHNAIFQCLPHAGAGVGDAGVTRILLTASGGPFRTTPAVELEHVSPDQACAHPNWAMGRKISVDSATLMNKGLELIEACWLFGTSPEYVQVHVHPESIIHSMVEYRDGSVLAQLGSPDMRTPIANALAWPERIDAGVASLDLFELASFHFERPDLARFPALRLAGEAFRAGGTAPTILNAVNEVAVDAFLAGRIGFTRIAGLVEDALAQLVPGAADSIERVMASDAAARDWAMNRLDIVESPS